MDARIWEKSEIPETTGHLQSFDLGRSGEKEKTQDAMNVSEVGRATATHLMLNAQWTQSRTLSRTMT